MSFLNKEESQPIKEEENNNAIETIEEKENELEFNKKNREDFENLMSDSSTNVDGYWDSNNPFVKVFLLVLGVIIVVGAIYYIMTYMAIR